MKKAKSYCGLISAVGIILIGLGILNIVIFNIRLADHDFSALKVYFFLSIGTVLLFLSYVISKIIKSFEVEIEQLRDRIENG